MGQGQPTSREIEANGLRFTVLEAGSGPLALCLHGFPDSAHTWRHLFPELADAGFHAVAPFMRGYAPTDVPADGRLGVDALAVDAIALHEALDGDERSVLIGHDWGAEAAYGAAALAPERWRRLVTLAVPPAGLDPVLYGDYEQLKRFFYMFAFLAPGADEIVAADGMAMLDRLWAEWSPGYDASEDLRHVKECLRDPANLSAAIGYYRADVESPAEAAVAPQPTLYLHGARDGCIAADLVQGAPAHLSPDSRMAVVDDAGHFLHLEQPARMNEAILEWVAA